MMTDILNICITAIAACNEWFMDVVNATGSSAVIVGFVCVVLSYRFILAPIVQGSGLRAASDTAKRVVEKKMED